MYPPDPEKMKQNWTSVCALLSGILLALCYPPTDAWFLAWVALVPLGLVLTRPKMTKHCWSGVYLAGLVYHLWILDWMRTLYGGVGLQGEYVHAWLITGQLGALLFCIMVAVGRRATLSAKLPVGIVLPLVWVGFEFLRKYATVLVDQTGAPWLSLASTQVDQLLVVQIADLGGEGLIGLVIAAGNGFFYETIVWLTSVRKSPRRWIHAASLSIVPLGFLAVVAYGTVQLAHSNQAPGPVVCLMEKSDLPEQIPTRANVLSSKSGLATNLPLLFVWPELAYDQAMLESQSEKSKQGLPDHVQKHTHQEPLSNMLAEAALVHQAGFLMGCERFDVVQNQVQRYNCLAYADPVSGQLNCYDKQHLVPFTEFQPANAKWLQISSRKNYQHGQDAAPFVLRSNDKGKEYRFGCSLCFDVTFSEHYRNLMASGPVDFFVQCGSEAADQTGHMSSMLLRMAKLRAIETRRPIVRNTHLGFSGLIDANGRFFQSSEHDSEGKPQFLDPLPLDSRTSVYVRLGDWVSVVCLSMLSLALILPGVSKARSLQQWIGYCLGRRFHTPYAIKNRHSTCRAFSLLELIAVIAILGTLALILVPRVTTSAGKAKTSVDKMNRAEINAAVERYYIDKGVWPANNLSDISADTDYFPEGIPVNPTNGAAYVLNATTHRVQVSGGGGGGK